MHNSQLPSRARRIWNARGRVWSVFALVFVTELVTGSAIAGPATELSVAKLERGTYLAESVARCSWCHSPIDRRRAYPVSREPVGAGGGFLLTRELGFPGTLPAPAITPTQLGSWSDEQLARAIVNGYRPDGVRMFRWVVHDTFDALSAGDVESVIAWVRNLEPQGSEAPERDLDLSTKMLLPFMPSKAQPVERPIGTEEAGYGEYLTAAAGCINCHSPRTWYGKRKNGQEFSGGDVFNRPDGSVIRSPNISPDKTTGIGAWTEEVFIALFRQFGAPGTLNPLISSPEDWRTEMPWAAFAGMTDEDLRAVYRYLMALEPIENRVIRFSPGPVAWRDSAGDAGASGDVGKRD